MRVLAADDDPSTLKLITVVLQTRGYEVASVTSGAAALDALLEPPSSKLVLLDWNLPGLDGVEVCRRVRTIPTLDPPYIIILTGRGERQDLIAALDAGANDYIRKPFDNQELLARLRVGERVLELQAALAQRIHALELAQADIRTLQGILPICMHCHRIRKEAAHWERLEKYIQEHTDARFSHSICPECLQRHYPDYAEPAKPGE